MASNNPPESPSSRSGLSQPKIETKSFDMKKITENRDKGIKNQQLKAIGTGQFVNQNSGRDIKGRSGSSQRKEKGSVSFVGQHTEVFDRSIPKVNNSAKDSMKTNKNPRDKLQDRRSSSSEITDMNSYLKIDMQKQIGEETTADNKMSPEESIPKVYTTKNVSTIEEGKQKENKMLEMTVNKDILMLIEKYPFEVNENVKIAVDVYKGILIIVGTDEDTLKNVQRLIVREIENAKTESILVKQYQVPFFISNPIQNFINDELLRQKIRCYWWFDQNRMSVVAWEKEINVSFAEMFSHLFRSKEIKRPCGDTANYLWMLYEADIWEKVMSYLKAKFGEIFQIADFKDDHGNRCLGMIAPKGDFEKIWHELENDLEGFKRHEMPADSKDITYQQQFLEGDTQNMQQLSASVGQTEMEVMKQKPVTGNTQQDRRETEIKPNETAQSQRIMNDQDISSMQSKRTEKQFDKDSSIEQDNIANERGASNKNEIDGKEIQGTSLGKDRTTVDHKTDLNIAGRDTDNLEKSAKASRRNEVGQTEREVMKQKPVTGNTPQDRRETEIRQNETALSQRKRNGQDISSMQSKRTEKQFDKDLSIDQDNIINERGASNKNEIDGKEIQGTSLGKDRTTVDHKTDLNIASRDTDNLEKSAKASRRNKVGQTEREVMKQKPVTGNTPQDRRETEIRQNETAKSQRKRNGQDISSMQSKRTEKQFDKDSSIDQDNIINERGASNKNEIDGKEIQGTSLGKDRTTVDHKTDLNIASRDTDNLEVEKLANARRRNEVGQTEREVMKQKSVTGNTPQDRRETEIQQNETVQRNVQYISSIHSKRTEKQFDKDSSIEQDDIVNERGASNKNEIDGKEIQGTSLGKDRTTVDHKTDINIASRDTDNLEVEKLAKDSRRNEDDASNKLVKDAENSLKNDESTGKTVMELSPTGGDFPKWRFAAHCCTIQRRIFDILQTEIKFNDEGHLQFEVESGNPNEQMVRDAISQSCQDIRNHTFTVNKVDSEDVIVDIESLKTRKTTRNHPVNPFQTGDAQIHVLEREPICDVVLFSIDTYFETCCSDLQHLISKYVPGNSDGKEAIPCNANCQERPQTQVTSMFFEEWKYNYLECCDNTFSKLEKTFDVEIKIKDKKTLKIIGRNQEHITNVKRELENVVSCLVLVKPSNYELYVWRLAFGCQELVDRINSEFKQRDGQIRFDDDVNGEGAIVIVQFKTDRKVLTDSVIKALLTEACKEIKMFDVYFPLKARADIDQDIGYLKKRKETELQPQNPFQLKAAEVYLDQGKHPLQFKLVLVCRQKFYQMCHDDVCLIIQKYDKELKMDKVPDSDMLEDEDYEDLANNGVNINKAVEPSSKQSLNISQSFNINCEKWKFECLKRRADGIDRLERKFKARIEMKDENTVSLIGEQSNLDQLRVSLQQLMKQLVREKQPVDLELYENLEADLDYKKKMEMFENQYHVALDLGKFLDYESDVEIQLSGGLHVVLTQAKEGVDLLKIELQESAQGFKIVLDGTVCPRNSMREAVNFVIECCVTCCMVVNLDSTDSHKDRLYSFLSDFLTCFQGENKKGQIYTVYICTAKARLYSLIKELLSCFDQPVGDRKSNAGHATDQNCRIEVILGELAKQKVDVMVNTSNENLKLDTGAVSNSLLKIAGQEMQHEVSKNYPQGIKHSQIAETKGYRLGVNRVLHSCLHSWNTRSEEKRTVCRQGLVRVVQKSLERTAHLHKTSIAFPALGTGVLRYPPEVVACDMINTVQQHYRDNPNTSIERVLFVIYSKDHSLHQVFKSKLDERMDKAENTEISDYCVVIAGAKDDVAEAKIHIRRELLSEPDVEISGRRQEDTDAASNSKRENLNHSHCRQNGDDLTKGRQQENGEGQYDSIAGYRRAELTPDKGAIPKQQTKQDTSIGIAPTVSHSEENFKQKHNKKDNEYSKPKESDKNLDDILDQFLDNLTVSLNKELFSNIGRASLLTIDKVLQKSHYIKMNVDELTLTGKFKDVSQAREHITKLVSEEKQKYDRKVESLDDDPDNIYENIDDDYEQHIFERTLSKEISIKGHCKNLKNVRREVFMLLKIFHEGTWKEITQDCVVDFDSGDVTIQCQDDDKLVEVYLFVKDKLSALDDFYYCDLLSHRLAEDVLDAAKFVKGASKDYDDVYFYEDDGMAKLACKSSERVDEFSRLVEIRLKGNQPSSRGNRQLAAADEKVESGSPKFERSFTNNPNAMHSRKTPFPGKQTMFKSFRTDEGINVYLYKAGILHLDVDCIVNAANSEMKHGGGIAKVIAQAAGSALENESRDFIRAHGKLSVGSSCVTSAGNLNYSRVIHTVGPCITDYSKEEVDKLNGDLYDAIYSSLDEAKNCQLKSIGIPSVSSGVYGVPKKWCAIQYCLAVKCFSQLNWNSSLKEVHFIDIDEEMLNVIGLTCDVVFNSNEKSKRKLSKLKCATNESKGNQFRRIFRIKKNFRRQKSTENYPRTCISSRSSFKIELSADFQIAVRKGNIVDFEKGVIVCPQDQELRCLGGVAVAIQDKDPFFKGILKEKHTDEKYSIGEVLVSVRRTVRCSAVYNVVLPNVQRSSDMNAVSLCYTQVLQKANQNNIEKIALPLFCTDFGKAIEQSARALTCSLIELFNSKGRHHGRQHGRQHKFPSVYIYAYKRKSADIIVRVLKEVFMEKTVRAKTKSAYGAFTTADSHSSSPETYRQDIKQQERPPSNKSRSSQSSTEALMESETETRSLDKEVSPKAGTSDSINEESYNNQADRFGPSRPPDGTLESMKCAICIDSFIKPKTLPKCGHTFCTECIDDYFKVKPVCPFCFTVYGDLIGTQPHGEMKIETDNRLHLPGYGQYGAIRIRYNFPDGTQGEEHPRPGQNYKGTRRTAYLPDNKEGRKVLKLLDVAFKRRLVFTIGRSVTTGSENTVTWNDIHHKTNLTGGSSNFGYPDPDYLTRVTGELQAKGVTEADIK